jgi:uncharacterized protein (TIGR00369 family)
MSLIARIEAELAQAAAPYVKALGLRVVEADDDGVLVLLPVTPQIVHGGGVVCGQAIMAAADTAMVCALSAALGGFRPMTTVQLQTSFLRPVAPDVGQLQVRCRILRKGKNLSFGEVEFITPDGNLAAHATTTYALL